MLESFSDNSTFLNYVYYYVSSVRSSSHNTSLLWWNGAATSVGGVVEEKINVYANNWRIVPSEEQRNRAKM